MDTNPNTTWLVDADNQSATLVTRVAEQFGWPARVVLAGLPDSLRVWSSIRRFPVGVEIEMLEAPQLPDAADILLAMAAGRLVGSTGRIIILSHDKLVVRTLGAILRTQGTEILAVANDGEAKIPSLPMSAAVQSHGDFSAGGAFPDDLVEEAFRTKGNPSTMSKAALGAVLAGLGHDRICRRQVLASTLQRFDCKGDWIHRKVATSMVAQSRLH